MGSFDDKNLASANQELQDIIEIAQLSPKETFQFLSAVSRELGKKDITLDFIEFSRG